MVSAFAGIQTWRVGSLKDDIVAMQIEATTAHNQVLLALAEKQIEINSLATKAQEIQTNADKEHEKLRSDILSGKRKLRERFTCPKSTDAPGPSGSDDASGRGLQPEDAEFLIGEAKRADDLARKHTLAQEVIRILQQHIKEMEDGHRKLRSR